MIENKKHYPAICFTKLPNSAINHSIRVSRFIHTFATMALQNGVDIKTVSSMLCATTFFQVTGHAVQPRRALRPSHLFFILSN